LGPGIGQPAAERIDRTSAIERDVRSPLALHRRVWHGCHPGLPEEHALRNAGVRRWGENVEDLTVPILQPAQGEEGQFLESSSGGETAEDTEAIGEEGAIAGDVSQEKVAAGPDADDR
jgi:hypothetical protein